MRKVQIDNFHIKFVWKFAYKILLYIKYHKEISIYENDYTICNYFWNIVVFAFKNSFKI